MTREVYVVEQVWADGDVEVWAVHANKHGIDVELREANRTNRALPKDGMARTARVVRYVPQSSTNEGSRSTESKGE